MVPLVRSQFRVFRPPEKHAWSQQSGFPTNYFIISISNTSITPPEFFHAWKSHISIEILHQNQNQIVSNSTFHNSRIPPTATLTSHFFSAFIRSFGFPPTSPQTEIFQYSQHLNRNKILIVRNSTLPNSQTPQSADFSRHLFSNILSSTISHHHVNSMDVKPRNSIGLADIPTLVFLTHSEITTVSPFSSYPYHPSDNLTQPHTRNTYFTKFHSCLMLLSPTLHNISYVCFLPGVRSVS